MPEYSTMHITATDGTRLAVHQCGPEAGHPVLLLHGFFSDANTNWIKYGHAALLAQEGLRLIMPDLRAHGESAKPHEASAYPPDILSADALGLINQLAISDYDLVGYSLGARTAVRMLVNGAKPRRVLLAGMGFEGVTNTGARSSHFANILDNLGSFAQGSPEWMAEAFLKSMKGDPAALRRIIDTFVGTSVKELEAIDSDVAVVCGEDDDDNGSATKLAAIIPHAKFVSIPGNHMSAVTKNALGEAMRDFLASPT